MGCAGIDIQMNIAQPGGNGCKLKKDVIVGQVPHPCGQLVQPPVKFFLLAEIEWIRVLFFDIFPKKTGERMSPVLKLK